MRLIIYAAATVPLFYGAALAIGREDARPSVEGTPPPERREVESPLDDATALKRDVEVGKLEPQALAAIMADGNAAQRYDDVADVAEAALGTPSSTVAAAEAARTAAARAEERITGETAVEPAESRIKIYAGIPEYQNDARIQNEAGVAYYALGRVADANERFLAAIAQDPNYDEPHANLGLLYRRKGWYEKALAEYDIALELRPTNATTWYNRAVALLRLARIESAVSSLETATKFAPKYRPPVRRLALIWYDLGDYEAARRYAQNLLYLLRTDEEATVAEIEAASELLTLAENRLQGKKAEPTLTVERTAPSAPGP
ncbi:MAG: tetratricopeptide repeat protein [candidate division Zixibacteria bacterium]|nr:tetratricopeptide repeat protein [candidate division Zixibacteria bacterium]